MPKLQAMFPPDFSLPVAQNGDPEGRDRGPRRPECWGPPAASPLATQKSVKRAWMKSCGPGRPVWQAR